MSSKRVVSSFAVRQIEMQRKNLIHVCRYAVKSLVDLSCSEGLQEKCPELENFCAIIEHILSYRLRPHMTWLGSEEPRYFWDYIRQACKNMPNSCTHSIQQLEVPKTAQGKGRAWVRMALMEKRLADYLTAALQQRKLTRQYYLEGSVIASEDPNMLAGMLLGLNAIDFSFDIKGDKFDYNGKPIIDFSPYLKFEQRPETETLDGVDTAIDAQYEGVDLDAAKLKTRCRQLEEKYKMVSEQKGYLDELVRLRESQLMEIQVQRQKVIENLHHLESESKKERQQLESIIIELQSQITCLKEDHHIQIQKLQTLIRHYMSDPPTIALTELPPRGDPVGNESTEDESAPSLSSEQATLVVSAQKKSMTRSADTHSLVSDTRSVMSAASTNTRDDTQSMVALAGSFSSQSSSKSDLHRNPPTTSSSDPDHRHRLTGRGHTSTEGSETGVVGRGEGVGAGRAHGGEEGTEKGKEGLGGLEPMRESPEYDAGYEGFGKSRKQDEEIEEKEDMDVVGKNEVEDENRVEECVNDQDICVAEDEHEGKNENQNEMTGKDSNEENVDVKDTEVEGENRNEGCVDDDGVSENDKTVDTDVTENQNDSSLMANSLVESDHGIEGTESQVFGDESRISNDTDDASPIVEKTETNSVSQEDDSEEPKFVVDSMQ